MRIILTIRIKRRKKNGSNTMGLTGPSNYTPEEGVDCTYTCDLNLHSQQKKSMVSSDRIRVNPFPNDEF